MASARFVVLGLALARSPWFRSVAQWANSAAIPVEFVKCMSAGELSAHLASGRAFSALLIDGALPAVDRDLVARATDAGCAVIIVDDLRITRDWAALGASAAINPMFDRSDLVGVLTANAAMIGRGDKLPTDRADASPAGWRASVAMVCGPGGTGVSTAAIALAQGLGDDIRHAGMVLLVDLALHAEQAMLHDARDVVPSIQEVAEAHRIGRPTVEELRALTFSIPARRYSLLLGLRRSRGWSSLRPRAFEAAFENLQRGWRVVVCDADSNLEGEEDGGSTDVELRHLMARTAAARADVVFAVGLPGMKGLHGLVRVVNELLDHQVPPQRIVQVVNRAPRAPRARAEFARAIASLTSSRPAAASIASPIFLPDRRVDDALRDGVRLPSQLTQPLAGAFNAVSESSGSRADLEPQLVPPGSIGSWTPEPAEAG